MESVDKRHLKEFDGREENQQPRIKDEI